MAPADYPVIVVTGPTASGKSRLGLDLARELAGEILCCDALQIYRGMDIGTAKPTPAERAVVSHHLLDVRNPDQEFSAGEYQRLGRAVLDEVRSRGAVPVVVGGTGLYLRALMQGLFEGPGRSDALRARMQGIAARGGTVRLYRALARADPLSAARIAPADLPRIVRAYEVYLETGRPLSAWHALGSGAAAGFRWLKLAIGWPRPELYARIDARVNAMFAQGLAAEVSGLLGAYPPEAPGFKAIGYRQSIGYLSGASTLQEAIESTKLESRHYAKRQTTWFGSDPDLVWLDGTVGEARLLQDGLSCAREFLGG